MDYSWKDVMPKSERLLYSKTFSQTNDLGIKPALLVIDCTYAFTGTRKTTIEKAIEEVPTACGEMAWEAIPYIQQLLFVIREKQLPIIYTKNDVESQLMVGKATKSIRQVDLDPYYQLIPDEIRPSDGEWVLQKPKASAFFSTSLVSYLYQKQIDSLIICGATTSGCVRATATDACSYGISTFVVEEACFDRSYFAHCANLFDINAKYASVISFNTLNEQLLQMDQ
nr:isochorismatase family protein [Halalkalibacterium ligniniphilum]